MYYRSLNAYLRETFGCKVYKLALSAGCTCPNRDGTLDARGCIFCSGSGEFAASAALPVSEQLTQAKRLVAAKAGPDARYIAYFQDYSNTYAPADQLRPLFLAAIDRDEICALSIATRPDCLPPEVLEVLERLNRKKPVWVELGLQTIHDETAKAIGRGDETSCFYDAFRRLKEAGLTVVVHVILGLPGEGRKEMYQTVDALGKLPVDGIKLQLLHVLRGTKLAEMYEENPFPIFTLEEYVDMVIDCVALLPAGTVIHRISGDGPKSLLIAPEWSGNKRLLLNTMTRRFKERQVVQGDGVLLEDGTIFLKQPEEICNNGNNAL